MNKPVGNVWSGSAMAFGFFSFSTLAVIDVVLDVAGFKSGSLLILALPLLLISLILWIVGKLNKHNPARVITYMLVLGVFGIAPIILFFFITGTGFSLALPDFSRYIYLSSLFIVTIAWCTYQMHGYRRRIIDRQYIEKEFLIERDKISMRLPSEVSLDTRPLNNETLWGRLYNKFGPYLFLLIPFAYPLQKLVTNESGFLGGLFLAALFAAPLAIYLLGRLTCGAYLYVYRVWQLERKYDKPVMFSSDNL